MMNARQQQKGCKPALRGPIFLWAAIAIVGWAVAIASADAAFDLGHQALARAASADMAVQERGAP